MLEKIGNIKKKIILTGFAVLIIGMAICLTSCGGMTAEEIEAEITTLNETDFVSGNSWGYEQSELKKLTKKRNFNEAVLSYFSGLREDGNFEKCYNLICALNECSYYDSSIKDEYVDFFKEKSNKIIKKYVKDENLEGILDYADRGDYSIPHETLGKRLMKYAEKKGKKTITDDGKGGYYDSKKWKFQNSTKRINPLNLSEWGVGTYREVKEYNFYGDFLIKYVATEWMTNSTEYGDNDANEYDDYLFYKGHDVNFSDSYKITAEEIYDDTYYDLYEMICQKIYAVKSGDFYYLIWEDSEYDAVYFCKAS